jgi:hypothetical protein
VSGLKDRAWSCLMHARACLIHPSTTCLVVHTAKCDAPLPPSLPIRAAGTRRCRNAPALLL